MNTERVDQETMIEATLSGTEEAQLEVDDIVRPVVTKTSGEVQVGAGGVFTICGEEKCELSFSCE